MTLLFKIMDFRNKYILVAILFGFVFIVHGQSIERDKGTNKFESFFMHQDTFNKQRFNTALVLTTAAYTGFSISLYNSWYRNFETGPFKLYNDWGEWRHMDKWGHVYSAYFQSVLCYNGAQWTGMGEPQSIWTGIGLSTLFQTTLEVMDGFSSKWGFSLPDMGANIIGTTIFASQQYFWEEQRISIKLSSISNNYPDYLVPSLDGQTQMPLKDRVSDLYGSGYFERFLKDYNSQIYWASIRVKSFLPHNYKWPAWLNVALGYSAENMLGGYNNFWTHNGQVYNLDNNQFPRYSQFYLGFDVDLPRLNPKSPFLKTVCSVFNIFKLPSPALELNTLGQIKFHLLR